MDFGKLYKDALTYPASDIEKLLIIGIFFIIIGIVNILSVFGLNYPILRGSATMLVISIILGIIISGYMVTIVKSTLNKSDELPAFNWGEMIVMGVKYVVLKIVYFIIPAIITLIVALVSGLFGSTNDLLHQIMPMIINKTVNQTTVNIAYSSVSPEVATAFGTSLAITLVVGIILFIIFEILSLVGVCRMAKTDSLVEGISMGEVCKDISSIGWLNYIAWFIIFVIITAILMIISGLISAIPFIGLIIAALIISPYISIYTGRALGLMYLDK